MIKSFLQKFVGIGENAKPQTQAVAPRSEQECNAILRKARQLYADRRCDECLAYPPAFLGANAGELYAARSGRVFGAGFGSAYKESGGPGIARGHALHEFRLDH